jgi:Ca-activated chloride channel family protein
VRIRCFVLFLVLLFCSCSDFRAKILISEGNVFYANGDYAQAAGCFFNALPYKGTAPYAEYAIGTSYLAMDEGEAALSHFIKAGEETAAKKENRELLYRIRYNTGIIHFQNGEYLEAAEDFKNALRIEPSRIEAKHNLELSLLSAYRKQEQANVQSTRTGGITENKTESRSGVLLDFMRQREAEKWKSFEWDGPNGDDSPDY